MERWIVAVVLLAFGGQSLRADDAKEPELRKELLDRVKGDQSARFALIEWSKKNGQAGAVKKPEFEKLDAAVKSADKENTARLNEIVAKHGWPTNTLVGKDGANAAWLLVQHADANPKFQRKCLDLMAKLPKDEISQTNLAYLTDRVLLAEGKKQVYGTQFMVANGKREPRPLEDPANVDKRRTEVGMKPLAEYEKDLEAMYGSTRPKVGDAAPFVDSTQPSGNPMSTPDELKGKVVLLAFWRFDGKEKAGMPFDTLRALRKAHGKDKRFLIVTVCVDSMDRWDDWSAFLLTQGQVDYGDGARRFMDDPKWWNTMERDSEKNRVTKAFGVEATPSFFLIGADGRLVGVRIAEKELGEAVEKALR